MTENYLSVHDWEDFQQYKDREPKWIKVHRAILMNYKFDKLTDAEFGQLVKIWLLASQMDNRMPNDASWIQKKAGMSGKPNIHKMIQDGFLDDNTSVQNCTESYKNVPREEEIRGDKRRGEERPPGQDGFHFERPTLLPINIYLTDKMKTYALSKGMGVSLMEDEFEAFCIHHKKNGSKFNDWYAAWQTWVRNHFKFHPEELKRRDDQLMECQECQHQCLRKEMERNQNQCPICGRKVEWREV